MSKKAKKYKQATGNISKSQRVEEWLVHINDLLREADYAGAIEASQRVINFLPQRSLQRAEALGYLSMAHSMLQNFPQAYDAIDEALAINPHDADMWFNHGVASRFTARTGRSVHDFERAVELMKLEGNSELVKKAEEELELSQKFAKESMKLRGPNFTLDQLIEQEETYQQGVKFLEGEEWEKAEQAFRHVIEMGDVLPQPWGNLGFALLMQHRYDEAEAAWKRALAIDKHYKPARVNLENLPEVRRTDNPNIGRRLILEPFKGSKMKQSVIFHH
jgi:tetratricopeptide (TPR) repeat protein